ncbi:MAG: hypothetical protein QME28_08575 [Candidatus Saccharicenans sp.]|nr:hypothetical protein [Candidatus Saccharicenans sp.]
MARIEQIINQVYRHLPGAIALAVAIWLLFPFIRIDRTDYTQGKILAYRLIFGLTILIVMLGKMGFDVFFPQGTARPVSSTKSVLFLIFGILLLAFVVYIIVQAGSLFMTSYPDTTTLNY